MRAAPQLLMFGAGPEAGPLLRIARTLGWYCCVADHREALLAPPRLEHADRLLPRRPAAALRELADDRFDAALVMTHVADTDLEALRAIADADVPYVGLLGPPARRDELLARLSTAERDSLSSRLRAPVGLRLGGEGPEAIALAIVAELQRMVSAA
jgi:xanthine dehydrogenase accessory factor